MFNKVAKVYNIIKDYDGFRSKRHVYAINRAHTVLFRFKDKYEKMFIKSIIDMSFDKNMYKKYKEIYRRRPKQYKYSIELLKTALDVIEASGESRVKIGISQSKSTRDVQSNIIYIESDDISCIISPIINYGE